LEKTQADLSWVVYIVRCRTGQLYTGCTLDLERRLRQHNSGVGSRFTRSRLPVTLVYKETASTRSEALRREHAIKAMKRREKLSLINYAALATSA
jgi:putative endonuclease